MFSQNSCDLGVATRRIVLHKESTLPSRCNCIPMRCVYDTYCIRESFRFFRLYSPSKSLSVNCCVKSSPPVRGSLGASSSPLEEFMFQGLQRKERERESESKGLISKRFFTQNDCINYNLFNEPRLNVRTLS